PPSQDGDVERHLSLQLQGALSGGPAREEAEEAEEEAGAAAAAAAAAAFLCPAAGCGQTFSTSESYEHHYALLHREVCASCKRSFPSAHLLDTHLLEWHDSLFRLMAERRDMYQCLVESCAEKFKSSKDRKDHLIKVHQYPADFRFDKPVKSKSTKTMTPPSRDHSVPMDVNIEACERSPGDAMETGPSETAADQAPQPGMENTPVSPPSVTQLPRPRIPPSICFGQGATRGFRSRKKRV
ncbi:PREDICTED: zinc finger protein 511, partial [Gekko japonicus]|uniref:Zinc finger protein 511 n=1 Tax=Gekko japonicus TaxID=146911 RepID=A0ABM1L753_GEKJA